MKLLWMLIPDELLILVVAVLALGFMVGLVRGRMLAAVLGGVVLMALAGPIIEALVDALPGWLLCLLLIWMGWWLLRAVAELILGKHAASHMVGILAADVVRACFRGLFWLLALPFRLAAAGLRRI